MSSAVTLSAILDATAAAVLLAGEDGIVAHANAVASALLGGPERRRLVGVPIETLIGGVVGAAVRDGRATSGVSDDIHVLDGGSLVCEWAIRPIIDDDGASAGAVVTLRDVTRVELERARLLAGERQAREDAEAASRAKDEFLAIVSHELRTPLTAVLGWAHMLRHGHHAPELKEKAIATIERNAKLQLKLIEDLLEVSRAISGKLRLNVAPVTLDRLVAAALDSVRPAIVAKRLVLTQHLDHRAMQIDGDAARLQQVVYNLLSNAIKFTPPGGEIRVTVERTGDHVEIHVSDAGRGIDREFLPHVFERFRQSDSSTTRAYGGLGLGLAIVRHLVELHGGTVRAESAGMDQGATFTVELPVRAVLADVGEGPPTSRPSRRPNSSADLTGMRVLVVDDHADGRELIGTVLRGFGADVSEAESARRALEVLDGAPIDVLVSDLSMPDVDGYELLREVRRTNTTVPVLALTAHASPQDRDRALAAGFGAYLTKPVDAGALAKAVARALRGTGTARRPRRRTRNAEAGTPPRRAAPARTG